MAGSDVSLWPAIVDPAWQPPPDWDPAAASIAADRLADLLTPALAAYLLRTAEERTGQALLADDVARQSRLMNRFNGGVQRRWMARIVETGIPVVALKGFVFAHTIYPDPDIRTIGDIDLLVRQTDLEPLLDEMQNWGFAFEELPSSPWGFISDASYLPMMSADGNCNVDVHVQPDCYPAYRSLDTETLFADSRKIMLDGLEIATPSPTHALVLCLTNAAKDKFGPFSVRKLIDVVQLLKSDADIDWAEVEMLVRDGHFKAPARVTFALLERLGLSMTGVPASIRNPPTGLRARTFEGLVTDYRDLFVTEPGAWTVLSRELALCTEPDVALYNAVARLKGLFRPRRGLPEGYHIRQ